MEGQLKPPCTYNLKILKLLYEEAYGLKNLMVANAKNVVGKKFLKYYMITTQPYIEWGKCYKENPRNLYKKNWNFISL